MTSKIKLTGTILAILVIALPLSAEVVEPGDADDKNVREVVENLDNVTNAHKILAPELQDMENDNTSVALFVPTDDSLKSEDVANISEEKQEEFLKSHTTKGLASKEPLEYVEWFGTESGDKITVSSQDDEVVLNDSISIVEAIPAENGIVYVIDESLTS